MPEIKEYRLTTIDNPYDPFKDFNSWFLFDVEKGYNTCGYIARIVDTYPDTLDIDEKTNKAINDIIYNDPFNIYKKVYKK